MRADAPVPLVCTLPTPGRSSTSAQPDTLEQARARDAASLTGSPLGRRLMIRAVPLSEPADRTRPDSVARRSTMRSDPALEVGEHEDVLGHVGRDGAREADRPQLHEMRSPPPLVARASPGRSSTTEPVPPGWPRAAACRWPPGYGPADPPGPGISSSAPPRPCSTSARPGRACPASSRRSPNAQADSAPKESCHAASR